MKIGDRVKVNKLEPNGRLHGQAGTVVSLMGGLRVKLDNNVLGWNDSTGSFEPNWLTVIEVEGEEISLSEMEKAAILAGLTLLEDRLAANPGALPGMTETINDVKAKLLPGFAALGLL